jgi:hypothetical protein
MASTCSLSEGPAPGCPGSTDTHLLYRVTSGFSASASDSIKDVVVVVVRVAARTNAALQRLLPLLLAAAPSAPGTFDARGAAAEAAEAAAAAAGARDPLDRPREVSAWESTKFCFNERCVTRAANINAMRLASPPVRASLHPRGRAWRWECWAPPSFPLNWRLCAAVVSL